MSNNTIIRFENITKNFPGVQALDNVSFEINKGEVHALLGENGAGKSTLLNLLHGVYPCEIGNIYINKNQVHFHSVHDALKMGISMVHQEVNLAEELSVGQNILLGYEPSRFNFINYKKLHQKADEILQRLGCTFKSRDRIHSLSVGEMQMIAIAKALYHRSQIIAFDEPTASLSNKEVDILFKIIKELKSQDITIIYVSHRLDEVFQITDRLTVLRDGRVINTFDTNKITKKELIKSMVGRDISSFAQRLKPRQVKDEVILEVHNFSKEHVFNDISFNLKKGEILGIAGLVGSKRTDLVRAIFGADVRSSGEVLYKGKKINIRNPQDALKTGIGLIPENRKTQGFNKFFNNAENIGLTCMHRFTKNGFVNHKLKIKNSQHYINQMNLVPPNPLYITANLSGGNQQKVIIAKWLSSQVEVLILDEPTKGVDVGAKVEIYRLLEELVIEGKSIIIISSELPEIIGMSDRVIVMREGKKMTEIEQKDLNEELILQYAMGGIE